MNKPRQLPWIITLAFFSVIILFASMGRTLVTHRDGLVHFFAGFYFFLRDNIPAMSGDAATWVPGLGAFLLAIAISHGFLRTWASKQNRTWGFATTVCCVLVLPVLFAVAFLVPGVILQVSALRDVRWFEESPNIRAHCRMELRQYAMHILSSANADPHGRLPEALDAMGEREHRLGNLSILDRVPDAAPPYEPTLYLGSGLSLRSDPSLPLCISTCYLKNGELTRSVITLGQDILEIHDSEIDAWIQRAMQHPLPDDR